MLLLQARGSMTAAELALELEVSERTVARDTVALSEAGVPVYADRGRAGGYRLIGGYRIRLTGLGRSEAEALFLSGVPSALREMGLADAGSAARLKVSAALVPELADAQESAAQRFHLDAPGWWQEPETPPLLPAVADAVWDDRRIAVRYRSKKKETERLLEPYGLVLKAGVWYVAARPAKTAGGARPAGPRASSGTSGADGEAGAHQDCRVYRVDRFVSVTPSEERFERDPAFGLPAFWAERAAAFARSLLREEVTLRLTEAGARRLRHVTDRTAADEALTAGARDERGHVTAVLGVESLEVAFSQLMGLGAECEVLGPPALRERFRDTAVRMAALHGDADEPTAG